MERASTPALYPEMLPPGTQVGPWRVVDRAGRGVHGAVYRAVRIGQEHAPPVALKLALFPRDPRFAREVELLSRQLHPHLPRLIDHGEWEHPDGTLHPYVAMEWVDGVPLYDWARLYRPTSQQMLRLLAQLALALQYLHAQDAVHRDVKGDNTLVRRSDSRLFLTDLGSGIYPGADTLTPSPVPPGTPAYRSPEAWLFSLQNRQAAAARYTSGPADDVYALGVTACRLVTGGYPEMGEAQRDEHGIWRMEPLHLPPALHSARVEPPLRALILRMLSMHAEERGTAAQLAQEMERVAASLPDSSAPVSASTKEQVVRQSAGASTASRAHLRSWRTWLAAGAAGLAVVMWARWTTLAESEGASVAQEETEEADQPDAGPVGLGDAVVSAATGDTPETLGPKVMAEDALPEPQPGQTRPDAKGRCPRKRQVALNGGCWIGFSLDQEGCAELNGHMYQGSCYVPIIPPGRSPTASPSDQP
jgi:eukaryotic-like serine/threonine-protein kinase